MSIAFPVNIMRGSAYLRNVSSEPSVSVITTLPDTRMHSFNPLFVSIEYVVFAIEIASSSDVWTETVPEIQSPLLLSQKITRSES